MNVVEEDRMAEARQKKVILQQARDFESLLQHPGWKAIYALHSQWFEEATEALVNVSPSAAVHLLTRWQAIKELCEREADVINTTLEQAKEIRGGLTLDDALLMEKLSHEQSEFGDPGSTDPTGY